MCPEFKQLHVVSDLHLGGPCGFQIFNQGQVLASFIELVALREPKENVASVLNGDIVDFLAEDSPMYLDATGAAITLAALQAGLLKKLSARRVVVEVNPTSNLLIGDLGDLTLHPLWRLRPLQGNGDATPVSICVGLMIRPCLAQICDTNINFSAMLLLWVDYLTKNPDNGSTARVRVDWKAGSQFHDRRHHQCLPCSTIQNHDPF
jgi:hypothetical protein